jgi:type II secretory pathway component GspD/PulD (secretin)
MRTMAFQTKTWGWKGMAARLLLVPVLAGASAATVRAQALTPSPSATPTSTSSNTEKARQLVAQAQTALKKGDLATAEKLAKQAQDLRATLAYTETRPETVLAEVARKKLTASGTKTAGGDPKELMKLGRQALVAGKIDQAQDYASQANQAATAKGMRWGLFDDTPASLAKDVQDARKKADRAQSDSLFKKAKELFAAKPATEAERLQNLDQAMNMAYQAKNLHGDYSIWDLGDKPDSLIAKIESEKVQLRKKAGTTIATATKAVEDKAKTVASDVKQAAATVKSTVKETVAKAELKVPAPTLSTALDPAKAEVLKLVGEGRELLAQGQVIEAKAKAEAARALAEQSRLTAAVFADAEDSPAKLAGAVQSTGKEMIDGLVKEADTQVASKATEKAEAALTTARELSEGLGLYTKAIDEKIAKIGGKAPMTVVMPAAPTIAKAPVAPAPIAPMAVAVQPMLPVTPPAVAAPNLLDQAAKELANGDLEMARKIAIQAHNGGDAAMKANAQSLLRQIDVEATAANKKTAQQAFANAVTTFNNKQYDTALEVFAKIDPALLTDAQKEQAKSYMEQCLDKTEPKIKLAVASEEAPGVARVGNLRPVNENVDLTPARANEEPKVEKPKGTLVAVNEKPANTVADEQKAMAEVAFQKLRQDGLDAMKAAGDSWSRGDTDTAMKLLEEYGTKVRASSQSAARQANLLRPIDTRLEGYTKLKHHADYVKKEATEKDAVRRDRLNGNVAEQMKQEEVKRKVAEINGLMKDKKFVEAEKLAAQVKLLDPDNPTLTFIADQTKYARRKEDWARIEAGNEQFNLDALNAANKSGPSLTDDKPLVINPEASRRAALRGEDPYQRRMTEQERKIEQTLSGSVSMKFDNTTLREAITALRSNSGLNIVTDDVALEDEKISLESVVVNEDLKNLSMKDALSILLEKARCAFVVENNVVKITTTKRSKGRLVTKVFHVMDLVTPIPEYGLSPHHTFAGAMAAKNGVGGLPGAQQSGPTPFIPNSGIKGGELVSNGLGLPGSNPGGVPNVSGVIQNTNEGRGQLAMSPQRGAYSQQLMKLVTGMVRPYSWSDLGGNGNLSYYDIGGALVVNQTADVIGEVQQLLDSLRRLQDLSVSVEIRVVSLSEAFFERVGVDFSMNIKTNNTTLEREFATSQFRPQPFLNDINSRGIVGFSPATSFTSDLDVPIRPSSFGLSLPPFGGYQPSLGPTTNGGLSLGLAFLNDIQVYMFLEAAQGNRRVNIMQAPKITMFNGQTSTIFVGDMSFFTTGLQVLNVGGQFVYLPQNTAIPIGQGFNPQGQGTSSGVSVTVQAVISSDRRFVRLNLTPTLTALASANVPLFPITTFVTPVFEGGSQGQPIPFTQFYQQPSFTEISAQTTVAVPDGGTVLLGGLKTMAQGRNEFGPPVLANVPYLNRLFKNIGIGTETRHVMLMVTPRIIINSEEELRQTSDQGIGGN